MSVTLATDFGELKVELYCETAPKTCFNFLALAASGYYDKSVFHRNMKGFMIQGGDPTGTGKGGASVWGDDFPDEFHDDNKHDSRGVLAMANKGPNTNRSQFFITYTPQPHLNNKYTVFGRVIHGFETLDAMEAVQVDGTKKSRPLTDITLSSITIHANPLADRDVIFRSPYD